MERPRWIGMKQVEQMKHMRLLAITAFCCCGAAHAGSVVLDLGTAQLHVPGAAFSVDTVMLVSAPFAPIGNSRFGIASDDEVRLQRGTDAALLDLFRRSFAYSDGALHIAVKVNELRLDESRYNDRGQATCAVHLEFLVREADGWYRVHEYGTSIVDKHLAGTEATETILIRALTQCFQSLNTAQAANGLTHVLSSPIGQRTPVEALGLPILGDTASTRGLYRSFHQFRANDLDSTTDFTIEPLRTGNGNPQRARIALADGSGTDGLWGFSDGARVHVNMGMYFLELARNGDRFTTLSPDVQGDMGMDHTVFGGLVLSYGNMGLLLALGPNNSLLLGPYGIGSPQRLELELDLLTGRLALNGTTLPKVITSRHFLICSDKSAPLVPVTVYMGDSALATLLPGKFHECTPEQSPEPIAVEVRAANGQHERFMLDSSRRSDQVFLISVKKNGELSVTEAGSQMRMPLVDALKESDREPQRQ